MVERGRLGFQASHVYSCTSHSGNNSKTCLLVPIYITGLARSDSKQLCFFQIKMNVSTRMAAVYTTVIIPKEAMLVVVEKDSSWLWTAKTA